MRRLILHLLVALFSFAGGTAASALMHSLLALSAEATIPTVPTVVMPTEYPIPVTDPLPCGCIRSYPVSGGVGPIQPLRVRQPIMGGVLNGRAISLPQPSYPALASTAHAAGKVTVAITIDECGSVIYAHAISGHPLLKVAAEQAACQARFSPTCFSGQPVKVSGVIIYNFEPS